MSTFTFSEQLEKGEIYETTLDEFYSQWFQIKHVSLAAQKMGIDRVFTSIVDGTKYTVEYKGDERASRSGNAFVETMSVDTSGKKGWAYTSCAQVLVYFIVKEKYVIRFDMNTIKLYVKEWTKKYCSGKADNLNYNTYGVCVPLTEFKKHGVIDKLP